MRIFRVVISIYFLVSLFPLLAQYDEPTLQVPSQIIEPDRYYLIKMQNGDSHFAKIIQDDNLEYQLINARGETFSISKSQILEVKKKGRKKFGSIGLGLGIPYGVFGVNVDVRLQRHFFISAGLGTAIQIFPMYNFGGKLVFNSEYDFWRPRISAYYGTNRIIYPKTIFGNTFSESFPGVSIGIGNQLTFGERRSWGKDFDILYLVPNNNFDVNVQTLRNKGYYFDVPPDIKISIGVRYCF